MPETKSPKLFVLDTNVILHDARCVFSFAENDVVLPITVLEELDRFKKGDNDINFQAREFLRTLDELTGDVLAESGAPLGDGCGRVHVIFGTDCDRLRRAFMKDGADHRILNVALMLREIHAPREVILVTKDTNLRMKAKAFGLKSQDYTRDKVKNIAGLYTGKRELNGISRDAVDAFYLGDGRVSSEDLEFIDDPVSNENFILKNGSRSVLATYDAEESAFVRIGKRTCFGISPRNSEQFFALRALTDERVRLVTLGGRAGSGKTLLSLAAALDQRSRYRQVLLARPIIPLSNRDIGFLPGDVKAKIDPYMQPLYDNLSVISHERSGSGEIIQEMLERNQLQISPLAYIRGRSLQRTYFIVDEAQNLTPHEVKTIITRAGEGTKIVLTGDFQQIDHPYLDSLSNGLTYVINRMRGNTIYAHVTLERGVRSALSELASELL